MARKKLVPSRPPAPSASLVRRESRLAEPAGPFEFMRRAAEEMDHAFGHIGSVWSPVLGLDQPLGWVPQIDVFERDQRLVVRADIPGLEAKDLTVEIVDDSVVIEGDRKDVHEERHGSVYCNECSRGHFYRSVPLPDGVKADDAVATFRNGVLEVLLPAPAHAAPHRRRIHIDDK